jgi:ABC-type Co2+ transport system permease subunit
MRHRFNLDRPALWPVDAWSAAVKPSSIKLCLRAFLLLLSVATMAIPAHAHVGNKDVFETITVGPYKFFVTVRTPLVVPGVANIEVRSIGAPVTSLTITPLLLTGEASKHPPTPDAMNRSAVDPTFFTGSLWIMEAGSWQVRFAVNGAAGSMAASVPVPAASTSLLKMQRPLGILLGILAIVLVIGIVGIVIAAVSQSRLTPGVQPDAAHRRRGLLSGGAALVVAILAVYAGGHWWNVEAAGYSADLYRSSDLHATLNNDILDLRIGDPIPAADGKPATWKPLNLGGLLVDHGHLMHLYAIREPGMDAVFHLHPKPVSQEAMDIALPSMPPGTYRLFADIVYRTGFPETETSTITVPADQPNVALAPEDASATPPALSKGDLGTSYKLPDGYTMLFDRPATITAETGYSFRFHLLDPSGKPATNMQPYLGMAGHAAFVKSDFSTFAHTHPDGSAAMPALMLAETSTAVVTGSPASMDMPATPLTSTVEFPYGFPSPGRYRIFIQMKHADTVETGVFDAEVH